MKLTQYRWSKITIDCPRDPEYNKTIENGFMTYDNGLLAIRWSTGISPDWLTSHKLLFGVTLVRLTPWDAEWTAKQDRGEKPPLSLTVKCEF